MLVQASLTNGPIVDTLIELNQKFHHTNGVPLLNPTRYLQLIGVLVYLTIFGLDIAYVVQVVS